MANEIERKFLVIGDFKSQANKFTKIIQGYISSNPNRTVRIRIMGESAFLTIKGKSNETGTTRYEWEKEIDFSDAIDLLKLCESGIIDKTRYIVPEETGLVFEVDEFYGENEGLILAEIEIPNENYSFVKPSWLGTEVTGDIRYYNSMLMKKPFSEWKK